MNILYQGNILIEDVVLTQEAEHEEELMKSDFVKLSWNDDIYRELPVDAYITHNGIDYTLLEPYAPEQKSECEWHYEPHFQHPKMYLGKVPFVRPTKDSSGQDITLMEWSYTGTLNTLLSYFVEQIDSVTGKTFTAIRQGVTDDIITVSFQSNDILSALSNVANQCECEWHIDWQVEVLYFGHISVDRYKGEEAHRNLIVGENVNIPSVRNSKEGYWNAFLAQGSTRNISRRVASGENVQSTVRLSLDKEKYPDGIIYSKGEFDNQGKLITYNKEQFEALGEKAFIKPIIFEEVYPKQDLFVYNERCRERYLKDDDGKFVTSYYDDSGQPVYKRYAVWYVRLAYKDGNEFKDFELLNNVAVNYTGHRVVKENANNMFFLQIDTDYTGYFTNTEPLAEGEFIVNNTQYDHARFEKGEECVHINVDGYYPTADACLQAFQSLLSSLSTNPSLTITGDAVSRFSSDVRHSQIIDGKKPIIAFQPNKKEGARDCPLAGRGNGDGDGHYGFEIIYHTSDQTISPNEADGDTGVEIKKGDYEIVFEQNNDYILPTTTSEGVIPKGFPEASELANKVNMYNIVFSTDMETAAQSELEEKTIEYITNLFTNDNSYTVKTNPEAFEEYNRVHREEYSEDPLLWIGQPVTLKNGGFELETRVMKLITKLDYDFEQEITVGNEVLKGPQQQLKEKVETLISAGASGGTGGTGGLSISAVQQLISQFGSTLFLSKQTNDTAGGLITFLRGFVSKAEAKIEGLLTALHIKSNEISSMNYTGDGIADTGFRLTNNSNGHSKLTVDELYVRMKAVFEELEIRKMTYVGGNFIFSPASSTLARVEYMTDNGEALGYSEVIVPFTFRSMPLMSKLMSRFRVFGTKKRIKTELTTGDLARVKKIRCYLLADDGSTSTMNYWKAYDLARCQTFNIEQQTRDGGTQPTDVDDKEQVYTRAENTFYWREVLNVSSAPVTLDDGKNYHYIDLGNHTHTDHGEEKPTDYAIGSDMPCAGDQIVCFGNREDTERQHIITIETIGGDAPAIKEYVYVDTFSLEGKRKTMIAPLKGDEFYARQLTFRTDYGIARVAQERGAWSDIQRVRDDYGRSVQYSEDSTPQQTVRKCYYFDVVDHNGKVWQCIANPDSTHRGYYCREDGTPISQATFEQLGYDDPIAQSKCYCVAVSDAEYDTLPENIKALVTTLRDYTIDEPSEQSAAWRIRVNSGANSVRLDLSNEMDMVFTNSAKIVQRLTAISTTVRMYDGTDEADITQATINVSIAYKNGNNTGTPDEGLITVPYTWATDGLGKRLSLLFNENKRMTEKVIVTLTYSRQGVDYKGELVIGASMGQPVYQLKPSVSAMLFVKDGTGKSYTQPDNLGLSIVKVDGTSSTEIAAAATVDEGKVAVRYSTSAMPATKTAGSAWPNGGVPVTIQEILREQNPVTDVFIAIFNTTSGALLDRETVPVVKDGLDGDSITKVSETYRYAKNTSGVRPAAGSQDWGTTKPALNQGEWLFTETTITWSDGSTTIFYTDERNPNDGVNGQDIVNGITTVTYCVKDTNSPQPADSEFHAYDASELVQGKWLWSKATTPYYKANDLTTPIGYSSNYNVSYISKDGKSITKKSETPYYIKNTTGVRPAANDPNWNTTKPSLSQGEWLFTKTVILWSDNSTTTLFTDERNPNDGISGQDIVVDGSTVMKYYVGTSNTTHPADDSNEWKDLSQVTQEQGKWLWSQATTYYRKASSTAGSHDAGTSINYNVSYISKDGKTGKGIKSITEYYQATNSSAARQKPTSTAGWSTDPNLSDLTDKWDENHKFLWNMEVTVYSNVDGTETTEYSIPQIQAIWTKDGKGIDSIQNYYTTNNSTTPPAKTAQGWSTSPVAPTVTAPFLWNYEVITYTDTTTDESDVQMIGHFGKDGVSVRAQYSADGTNWHNTFTDGDEWMRTSTDNGSTWSTAVKIVGENGSETDYMFAISASTTGNPPSDITTWNGSPVATTSAKPYLWSKVVQKDGSGTELSTSYIRLTGEQGPVGRGVTGIAEFYKANNSTTAPTVNDSQWDNDPNLSHRPSSEQWGEYNIYLWNYERVEYSSGTQYSRTTPSIIAIWTQDGAAGRGIDSIQNKYKVTSSSNPPEKGQGWDDNPTAPGQGEYLWGYEIITWVNGNPATTETSVHLIAYAGIDGTSPWFSDIDNENDSIACDLNGHPTSAQTITTTASMWQGSQKQASTIRVFDEAGYEYTSGTAHDNITVTWNNSTGVISVSFATAATITKKEFTIRQTAGTQSLDNTLTISGVKPGANGQPATIYNLKPSKSSINVGREDGAYNPSTATLTCGYTKNVGGTMTTVDDVTGRIDSTYNLYFRFHDRGDDWDVIYYLYSQYKSRLSSFDVEDYDAVEFILCTNTGSTISTTTETPANVIDRETVPVVSDGDDGDNGDTVMTIERFKASLTKPATPTDRDAYPTGWLEQPPSIDSTVEKVSDWYVLRGNNVNDAFVCNHVKFNLTDARQSISFDYVVSSQQGQDFLVFGDVDVLITNREDALDNGTVFSGQSVGTFTVPDAISVGEHFIDIIYTKDNSGNSGDDLAKFKPVDLDINIMNIPIWVTRATFINDERNGNWSEPTRWNGSNGGQGSDGPAGENSALLVIDGSPDSFNQSISDPEVIEEIPSHSGTVPDAQLDNYPYFTFAIHDGLTQITDVSAFSNIVASPLQENGVSSCTCQRKISNPDNKVYITGIGQYQDEDDNEFYFVKKGGVSLSLVYNGQPYVATYKFRVNLLGTFETTIKDDVEQSVARAFSNDEEDDIETVGNYIRSSAEATTQLTKNVISEIFDSSKYPNWMEDIKLTTMRARGTAFEDMLETRAGYETYSSLISASGLIKVSCGSATLSLFFFDANGGFLGRSFDDDDGVSKRGYMIDVETSQTYDDDDNWDGGAIELPLKCAYISVTRVTNDEVKIKCRTFSTGMMSITAHNISMGVSDGVKRTGIDIEAGKITLDAENVNVTGTFTSPKVLSMTENTVTTIEGGLLKIESITNGSAGLFMINTQGEIVLQMYDKNGKMVLNLGGTANSQSAGYWTEIKMKKFDTIPSSVSECVVNIGDSYYQLTLGKLTNSGTIIEYFDPDGNNVTSNQTVVNKDGHTLTSSSIYASNIADGYYIDENHGNFPMAPTDTGVPKYTCIVKEYSGGVIVRRYIIESYY